MGVADLLRPVGYVLRGGGSLGAVQVGMLQALGRRDIVPGVVAGTSVGSLNGAVVALDPKGAANPPVPPLGAPHPGRPASRLRPTTTAPP
jgi:NTE family protein